MSVINIDNINNLIENFHIERHNKANLMFGFGELLNGYVNISPIRSQEGDIKIGDVSNVDWIIDNGELEELIAMNVLEYFEHHKVPGIISNWVSKIKVGGKLIVGFCDSFEIARMYVLGMMQPLDYNILVHGKLNPPHYIKKSSHRADLLITSIEKAHSFKLIKHTLNGVDVTLTFERTE